MPATVDTNTIDSVAMYMIWAINQAGYEARLCGGAVRDLLLGRPPKDWDIATTALPEQVVEVMDANNIKTIPTGLQHGTITAVRAGVPCEITTLRIDTNADGRHADVVFTDDWELDAARRDFTINAMYIDEDGRLYDYHNGVEDIRQCNRAGHPPSIRFVGDPSTRIQEDYLRILRYFRFMAQLDSNIRPDFIHTHHSYKAIIHEYVDKISTLSGERIWAELSKIFGRANYKTIAAEMKAVGIFDILGITIDPLNPPTHRLAITPATRLGGMVDYKHYETFIDVMKNRFHCSNDEVFPLRFVWTHHNMPVNEEGIRILRSQYSLEHVMCWVIIRIGWEQLDTNADGRHADAAFNKLEGLYSYVRDLKVPDFPISGHDLLDLGYPKGHELGYTLDGLKTYWAQNTFMSSKNELLEMAKSRLPV